MRFIILFSSSVFIILFAGCTQPPAPVTHYGLTPGAGSLGRHTMQAGETIYDLSQRYNRPLDTIIKRNAIQNPRTVKTGERIALPAPDEYTVHKDDTIYSIAKLFDLNPITLAKQNDVYPHYIIYEGQILQLRNAAQKSFTNTSAKSVMTENKTVTPLHKPSRQAYSKAKTAPKSKEIPKRSQSKFLKPVHGEIISKYGPKKGGLRNDGINYAAPLSSPVKAAENGRVVYVGNRLRGTGNLVLIRHTDNWMSAYAHLKSVDVDQGDEVKRGDVIGKVGKTGSVKTPQLHFELRKGTKAVNPAIYLGK